MQRKLKNLSKKALIALDSSDIFNYHCAMDIVREYSDLPDHHKNHVVIIGNFDGAHRAHAQLIEQGREIAKAKNLKLAVLTFNPHPREIFRPDDPPFRIMPEADKYEHLRVLGVDTAYVITFDWDFASRSAENFIEYILKDGLGAVHVIVGYDFRFGQMRKGTPEMIAESGIETTIIPKIEVGRDIISSSVIRQKIRHGKIAEANALLGWDWFISGVVAHGDKRGRTIGYPTANFNLDEALLHPLYGVYAARVRVGDENQWYNAAVNIGIRPMFETHLPRVESYIFDFDRDIYGQKLTVQPVAFMRSEAKFDSIDALVAQMDEDCKEALRVLSE